MEMIYSSMQDLKEHFLERKKFTLVIQNIVLCRVLNDLNITNKSSRGFQVLNKLSNGKRFCNTSDTMADETLTFCPSTSITKGWGLHI